MKINSHSKWVNTEQPCCAGQQMDSAPAGQSCLPSLVQGGFGFARVDLKSPSQLLIPRIFRISFKSYKLSAFMQRKRPLGNKGGFSFPHKELVVSCGVMTHRPGLETP